MDISHIASPDYTRPIIEKSSQLEENSSWRKVLHSLETIQNPEEQVEFLRRESRNGCLLAFAYLMTDFTLQVSEVHEILYSAGEDVINQRTVKLLISICPRAGKSLFSQILVAYLIGADDSSQNIIGSYGLALSNKFSRGIIAFTKHPEFIKVFPDFRGYEPGSKTRLKEGGTVLATSPGSALTGFSGGSSSPESEYPGALILDDAIRNGNSLAAIKELSAWLDEEFFTRVTFVYAIIIIATRFHTMDAHGVALEKDGVYHEELNPDGWRYINIPALCDNEDTDPLERKLGESLWPENKNFSEEYLEGKERSMSQSSWESLYQGNPVPSEGAMIKNSYLRVLPKENYPKKFRYVFASIDSAMSEKEDADESVITIFGVPKNREDQNIYILEMFSGNWMFPELLSKVEYVESVYEPRAIVIEKKSSGHSLIQTYTSELNTEIVSVMPSANKQIRLQGILHMFEQRKVILPAESANLHKAKSQLTLFPKSIHDDYVDSIVYGLFYYTTQLQPSQSNISDSIFGASMFSETNKRSIYSDSRKRLERTTDFSRNRSQMWG